EEHSAKTRRVCVLENEPDAAVLEKLAKRAPRQHAILSLLQHAADRRLPTTDLGDGSAAAIKAMEKAGLLRIENEEVRRDPEADGVEEILESKPLELNDEQGAALESIVAAIQAPEPKPI